MNEKSKIDRPKRLPIQLLVDFMDNKSKSTYFIENLGSGGLFIETNEPLPVNSVVRIRFMLPHNREEYDVIAKVVWSRKKASDHSKAGMGIKFENLDSKKEQMLVRAIDQYESLMS